jgi:hypothetical protein
MVLSLITIGQNKPQGEDWSTRLTEDLHIYIMPPLVKASDE